MAGTLISVVIPSYNRGQLLQRTVESVAAQTHRPLEVVAVDDASTDDTAAAIDRCRELLEERGIGFQALVFHENRGVAAARNAGLLLTQGAFVSFLDSDDLWDPAFLCSMLGLFERHPTAGVAFSGHVAIDIDDNVVEHPVPDLPGAEGLLPTPFERLTCSFPYITSATLVRRTALDTIAGFDETLPAWQDADLWLRIAKRFDFAYTLEPLALYRLHDNSIRGHRLDWYTDELRVWLRHVDDVRDPATRRLTVEQIRRAHVLLQEELLRAGVRDEEHTALLDNEFAPGTARYRLGQLVIHGPRWLGRSYAAAIRAVGDYRRENTGAEASVTSAR
jgi:glycosyltransferase involved in cell wall biosynthesis